VDIPGVLETRGRQKIAMGDFQGGAGACLQAASQYEERGDIDAAMDAVVIGSAALTKGNDRSRAVQVLRSMALRHPQHTRAGELHLQGIWLSGKGSGTTTDEFLSLFKEHFRNWPDQPTTVKGIEWVVRYISESDQWSAGAETLLEVSSSAKVAPMALRKSLDFSMRDLRETWLRNPAEAIVDAEKTRNRILSFGENGLAREASSWIENLFLDEVTLFLDEVPPAGQQEFGTNFERHFQRLARTFRQGNSSPPAASWNELLQGLDEEQRLWGSDLVRRFVEDGRQRAVAPSPAAAGSMLELLTIAPDFGERGWLTAHLKSWVGDWPTAVETGMKLATKETVSSRARLAEHWESLSTPSGNEGALQLWNHTASKAQLGSGAWREARLQTVRLLLRLGRRKEAEQVVGVALGTLSMEDAAPFRKLME
jgi:hypothetical protein